MTSSSRPTPLIDIVVPVYNEERELEPSVRQLRAYLDEQFPFAARITIADNASTDTTWETATRLASELVDVRALHLDRKGRGRALRQAWLASDSAVLAYMDVDLSTGLDALLPLIAPLVSGHSDIAIGSRLAPGSRVTRGPKREFISRTYNLILRTVLRVRFRDAQCGFKAIRSSVAQNLLPMVQDQAWFFDTELLVLAERAGLRIHEVPVDWVDDPDSRVDVVSTAIEDLRGTWRLFRHREPIDMAGLRRRGPASRLGLQARRFAVIGLVSTAAYAALYVLLRTVAPAPVSKALALVTTAVGNTAANRRLAFGVRGRGSLIRDHAAGLAAFGVALAVTTAGVAALHASDPHASRVAELVVLIGANAVAAVSRFALLRSWIAHDPQGWRATFKSLERTVS
jgi:glycosyltransferase involved in cell wall biosynthesis